MHNSLNFMRLDYLTIKQYLRVKQLGFFAAIILVLTVSMNNLYFVTGMLMMYGLFYTAYPFAIGDKVKLDVLYATLPIGKKQLVMGRYLYAFSINLATAVIALVLTQVVDFFLRNESALLEHVLTVVVCFFAYTFLEAIQFPIFFKLGYNKARIYALFPLFLLPLLVGGIRWIVGKRGINPMLLFSFLEENYLLVVLFLFLLWCVVIISSIQISCRIYRKREVS